MIIVAFFPKKLKRKETRGKQKYSSAETTRSLKARFRVAEKILARTMGYGLLRA